MPVWLMLFLPGALAAVIVIVHVTGGGGQPARFTSLTQAQARILQDVPTWTLDCGVLAVDGQAALFACPGRDCIALARAHGIGFFTRFIDRATLRAYQLGDEGALHLFLDDFTSPTISLVLPPEDVPAWRARLADLAGTDRK